MNDHPYLISLSPPLLYLHQNQHHPNTDPVHLSHQTNTNKHNTPANKFFKYHIPTLKHLSNYLNVVL